MNKKLVIILVIVGIVVLIGGAIFFINKDSNKSNNGNTTKGNAVSQKEDYTKLDDATFLSTIGEWEKEGSPKNIWVFKADGTGKITTDGEEYFDWTWTLNDMRLVTITKWLYDIEDAFDIRIDKEKVSFTAMDLETNNIITYVKKGSQNIESTD